MGEFDRVTGQANFEAASGYAVFIEEQKDVMGVMASHQGVSSLWFEGGLIEGYQLLLGELFLLGCAGDEAGEIEMAA